MNAVIYTTQLEPITVVDIPMFLWEMLLKGQEIRLHVFGKITWLTNPDPNVFDLPITVTLFAEKLRYRKAETLMLFTKDEEHALALRADFLPGQRSKVQELERESFACGFIKALIGFSEGSQR